MTAKRSRAQSSRLAMAFSLAAVLAFVLVITVPFAGQAFHIDDAIFWDFARTNLDHPLQQHIDQYRLMGQESSEWRDTHPPVDHLAMAGLMALTGSSSEPALHLGFIFFPLVAGISMFFLARRFTGNALLSTLLLLATPAAMTMSHTLMADVPLMAFWLAATAAYIYGVDRESGPLLILGGALAAIAVFTGYQALVLIVLLPLYALLMGRLSWKTAIPVLLPALGFALYAAHSLARYDSLPRFTHAGGLSVARSHLLDRIQGNLLQIGGASIFPLILAYAFIFRGRRYLLLGSAAAAALGLGVFYYLRGTYPLPSAILFTVFFTAAATMTLAVLGRVAAGTASLVRGGTADRDYLFLGIWLLAMMGVVALLLPHATAKYSLPFLAPLVLLVMRELEAGIRSGSVLRGLAAAAVALTLITGLAVSAADYRLAGAGRDFAEGLSGRFQPSGDVWFVGEWGFRHYMEAEGYRYLASDNDAPRDGDLVVRAEFADWPLAPGVSERMRLVDVSEENWAFPLRVMNFRYSAGFYGSHWGDLPFAVTDEPLERFEVYRLGPSLAGEDIPS